MKQAIAGRADLKSDHHGITELSAWLDTYGYDEAINEVNWSEYSYKPSVRFKIAFSEHEIFLKFYVHEQSTKAEMTEDNQPVYEDSCVEFFISPTDDGSYYNLEFNAIGTCLMGFGKGRENRLLADNNTLSKIRRLASSGNKPFSEQDKPKEWELTLAIPFSAFFKHNIVSITGQRVRANFYKCGDKLTVPHYLSWNGIETNKPDFHRPEYFGELLFE